MYFGGKAAVNTWFCLYPIMGLDKWIIQGYRHAIETRHGYIPLDVHYNWLLHLMRGSCQNIKKKANILMNICYSTNLKDLSWSIVHYYYLTIQWKKQMPRFACSLISFQSWPTLFFLDNKHLNKPWKKGKYKESWKAAIWRIHSMRNKLNLDSLLLSGI